MTISANSFYYNFILKVYNCALVCVCMYLNVYTLHSCEDLMSKSSTVSLR